MVKTLKYKKYMESIKANELYDMVPDSIKEIQKLFKADGKKLYLVGGSVRDFKTKDIPKDFDLATDAMPEEVMGILKGYRKQLQGKAFGVVVVYTDDQPEGIEIATFRQDISKGRNPEVKLGVSIEDDVHRRDLTYNAMFYDLDTKEIHDFTGGQEDLEKGITRFVGDPYERIDEDSLRILRAFRFASRYNHKLDIKTIEAIKKRNQLENIDPETGEMKRISSERIYEEMVKAWKQAKDYNFYLGLMTEYNMWEQIFPGSNINTNLIETDSFNVCLTNLFRNEPTTGLRDKLVEQYQFPAQVADTIVFLLNLKTLNLDNAHELKKSLMQKNADVENIKESDIREWIRVEKYGKLHTKFMDFKPTEWGKELMKQGWKQGKELGQEIDRRKKGEFRGMMGESKSGHNEWEEYIDEISDIVNIANDEGIITKVNRFRSTYTYSITLSRSTTPNPVSPLEFTIDQRDFINIVQEIVDRINRLGFYIEISMHFYSKDDTDPIPIGGDHKTIRNPKNYIRSKYIIDMFHIGLRDSAPKGILSRKPVDKKYGRRSHIAHCGFFLTSRERFNDL